MSVFRKITYGTSGGSSYVYCAVKGSVSAPTPGIVWHLLRRDAVRFADLKMSDVPA